MKRTIFPQKIYVVKEEDKSEVYYLTYENISEIPEDQKENAIGVYNLAEKKVLLLKKELI